MSRVNRYEYKDWKDFGGRTKTSRERVGMTKEKFAEKINRSENYVSEFEKGNTTCSVHTLHQISKVLRVPTDYLRYGNIEMKKEYTNKEIILEIIERADEDQLEVIKDLIVAIFPDLEIIDKYRKGK